MNRREKYGKGKINQRVSNYKLGVVKWLLI